MVFMELTGTVCHVPTRCSANLGAASSDAQLELLSCPWQEAPWRDQRLLHTATSSPQAQTKSPHLSFAEQKPHLINLGKTTHKQAAWWFNSKRSRKWGLYFILRLSTILQFQELFRSWLQLRFIVLHLLSLSYAWSWKLDDTVECFTVL